MSRKSRNPSSSAPKTSAPAAPAPVAGPVWIAARVLLVVALAVSAYLAWVSLRHGTPIGCGPESDCDRVLGSRWARWFGVPVSVFAVLVDALTLWGTFQVTQALSPAATSRGWRAVSLGSALILGAAVWFIALQALVVGWCPYCMSAHAGGVVAAVLVLAQARRQAAASFPGLLPRAFAGAGLALAVLVAGQWLHRPQTGRELKDFAAGTNLTLGQGAKAATNAPTAVTSAAPVVAGAPVSTPPATTPGTSPATNAAAPPQAFTPGGVPVAAMKRPFQFYDGMAALDLEDVPVIGATTNVQTVISLFDYTCHHCREMHPLLEEAQRAFSNQLVIASLPMPLDASCNRTVTRTPRAHTNACELARLGLIVWRADRSRHHAFDAFLMTGPEPPPLAAALGRAVQLVGTNALARAAMDPWVEERLQFSIALYEAAYRRGQGRMPQLIVGRNVAVGTYPRDELFKLLSEQLGLRNSP